MVESIIGLPLLAGIVAYSLPKKIGQWVVLCTGILHLVLTCLLWHFQSTPLFYPYLAITSEGLIVLLITSCLFVLTASYMISFMAIVDVPSTSVFTAAMLCFLSTMSMVALADHFMVFWIAIEATTLSSAPLIFIYRTRKSLEATLKYLVICSVGIALALLGSLLIRVSTELCDKTIPFTFSHIIPIAKSLDIKWLKAGFIFILVGYGTKMGIAPMHTWLPDAHSESPSPVSALLSGALLNCAYLGIFKCHKVLYAAGIGSFSGTLLIVFGLISMLVATIFIIKQTDYKRLLAYSSIENMGIIAFGTGVGGLAAYGAMLHLIYHAFIKSSLFLCSGNILIEFGTKQIEKITYMTQRLPKTSIAFFAGVLGISGFPPFGIFLSKLFIILGTFQKGYYIYASIFLFIICVLFAGLLKYAMIICFNESDQTTEPKFYKAESYAMVWQVILMLTISVLLCFWMPSPLSSTILQAVAPIGGGH
ncbi:MAG: hydrogenase [Desulfobacterales bacterium]|nr:hydrogenase [Desulfobacterales bacterium]